MEEKPLGGRLDPPPPPPLGQEGLRSMQWSLFYGSLNMYAFFTHLVLNFVAKKWSHISALCLYRAIKLIDHLFFD